MAWTDYYIDQGVSSLESKGEFGTACAVNASSVLTPGTAPGWAATGNPLAGRTLTIAAGTYTIATHNATTILTWSGGDPAENATAGAWRLGAGTTSDPWGAYGSACRAIGATAGAPTRIYVRGNQTLSAAFSFSSAGTSAYPIYWVGCTGSGTTWTRIGNVSSTSRPTLTGGANQVDVEGAYNIFEGLSFTSATSTTRGTFDINVSSVIMVRCWFVNTNAASTSRAVTCQGFKTHLIACYCSATTTADRCVSDAANALNAFVGNHIVGGDVGIYGNSNHLYAFNIVTGFGTYGIQADDDGFVFNNTVYGGTGDGIRCRKDGSVIFNNLIKGGGSLTNPINQSATAKIVSVMFNAWHSVTNDAIGGVIEGEDNMGACFANPGLLGTDPLPNAATANFTPAASAYALSHPGQYENLSQIGYLDVGAVDHADPAGGGGGLLRGNKQGYKQ